MIKESPIGKIDVEQRAVRIEDLSDRVKIAVELYKAAQRKFDQGQDSLREWENIIKVLNAEIKHIERFVAVAYHNQGVIYAQRNDLKAAKKFFELALMIDEDYPVANFNLAVIYKKLGNRENAARFLRRAQELGYTPK